MLGVEVEKGVFNIASPLLLSLQLKPLKEDNKSERETLSECEPTLPSPSLPYDEEAYEIHNSKLGHPTMALV